MDEPAHELAEPRSAEEALEEAEERFRAAFEHAPIGMAIVAPDGRYLRVNRSFCDITGYPADELVGRTIAEITHADDRRADREYIRRLLEGQIPRYTLEKRYVHSTGATVWARLNVSLVRNAHGQPLHLIKQIEDISDRKAVEERLLHQVLHDPLTGLHSRLRFMDRLTHALARSERQRTPVAVLFVDLDHFKDVNDRYGHRAGDDVLIAVARTLEKAVRPSDTVARLAGDEFAVLCEDMNSERDAVIVAQRLCDALRRPIDVGGKPISATASIGIAFAQEGDDPHTLLKHADAAMYKVKEGERGSYEIYLDAL
jgi:diguanylate cyclase (GGDEF)-like protein/PAS domain S-box-containing protein